MKRCAKCAEKIQDKATVCRYCGAEQPARQSNKSLYLVSGAILLACLVVSRISEPAAPLAAAPTSERSIPATPGARCKGYRGEARNLAGLVKRSLRNPESFEHVETTYGPVDDGAMVATMTYRATNGYGATDTYSAIGEVRVEDCAAKVIKAG